MSQPTMENDDNLLDIDIDSFIAENANFLDDLLASHCPHLPDQRLPQASLEIVEQPKRHYESSFESNLKNNTHQLFGANSKKNRRTNIKLHVKATQPISQIQNMRILCAICFWPISYAKSCTRLIPEQSPQLLINNSTDNERQNSKNCKPLLMEPIAPASAEMCDVQLNNFHIVRASNDRRALMKKDEEFAKWYQGRDSLSEAEKYAIENKATERLTGQLQNNKLCLYFRPVFENNGRWTFCGDPVTTDYFIEYFLISTIRPAIAKMHGGIEIVATAKAVKSGAVTVHIYEEDASGQLMWEKHLTNVPFGQNKEIKFVVPPYDGTNSHTTSYVNCSIDIICESDESRSKPVKFVYTSDLNAAPKGRGGSLKRSGNVVLKSTGPAKRQLYGDGATNADLLDVDSTGGLLEIAPFLDNLSDVTGSPLDADDRKTIIQGLNDEYFNSNKSGEHLLHRICGSNKYAHFISALVLADGTVCAQTNNGQTPLHIAIADEQNECIAEFGYLFENSDDYPEVTSELKELLSVYNADGYTVIHLAVLNNLAIIVTQMLEFCIRHSVDACAIETLGCGDTILHLAAAKGLRRIASLIMDRVPNADTYENYAGQNVYDADAELLEQVKRLSLT